MQLNYKSENGEVFFLSSVLVLSCFMDVFYGFHDKHLTWDLDLDPRRVFEPI